MNIYDRRVPPHSGDIKNARGSCTDAILARPNLKVMPHALAKICTLTRSTVNNMVKNYKSYIVYVAATSNSRARKAIKGRRDEKNSIFYILNEDGTETAFPIRFIWGNYLLGDVLRVVFNFATGTATPLPPLPLTYADPIRDPGVSALVKSGVSLANKAIAGLTDLTGRVQSALDAGVIPAALYQEVEDAKTKLLDVVTLPTGQSRVNNVRRVKVNLIEGGRRIIYPVRLRGTRGSDTITSRVDPGAEDNVMTTQKAEKLGATVTGTEILEGFTGGSVEVPLVKFDAILKDGTVIPTTAAVSDLVKEQTGKDFLVGAELWLKAKDAGELMA